MELTQKLLDDHCSYLKKTKYPNKIQKLLLEHCTDDHGDLIKLNLIQIKKSVQRQGYGGAILGDITSFADQHNVRIILWVTDVYGMSIDRLYSFYKKHGFIIKKNNKGEMLYHPRK